MFDRRPAAALDDPAERVGAVVARHGELLRRVARSYSLCADDAQDAVQRALEIYMRRVESLDPATELAWLKVVVIRTLDRPMLLLCMESSCRSSSARPAGTRRK